MHDKDFLKKDSSWEETIGYLKKKIAEKRWMSANKPIEFMKKYMDADQVAGWKRERDIRRAEAIHTRGFDKDKLRQEVWFIPQELYTANKPYWEGIIMNKEYKKHPEFLITNPLNNVRQSKARP